MLRKSEKLSSLIILAMLSGVVSANAADLSGKWKSKTGAVYAISQKGTDLLATYDQPNDDQTKGEIKAGDIAVMGDLIGNFLVAKFYQRLPVKEVPACSSKWFLESTIYFQVSEDGNTLEGDLLRTHVDDNCKVDKHWLQHLIWERQ